MSESIEKTIDIDKILKSKMGSKVKFVPRFLVSWLKKIIHEEQERNPRSRSAKLRIAEKK
jgi:16S rRNA C1402 N4-methylase RsmH